MDFWHGGMRWLGGPEVKPPKAGKYECGPGIYLTNRYLRARSYARGNKVVTRVTLAQNIRWLEQATASRATVESFLNEMGGRIKSLLLAELERNAVRYTKMAGEPDNIPLSVLVNLGVNLEFFPGKKGLRLAEWLVEQGVDASLHPVSGGEQWVVVFNPKVIVRYRTTNPQEVALDDYELPSVS